MTIVKAEFDFQDCTARIVMRMPRVVADQLSPNAINELLMLFTLKVPDVSLADLPKHLPIEVMFRDHMVQLIGVERLPLKEDEDADDN